ncbi:YciI family protein [Microbispora corallina]|uniref:Dehydrogenase n=1 Tax=Microbispora corallina TaxID=83302 RepID=A0ABQ4G8R4_9ACTN|nr:MULTISPECIES: YciI family protein [Actinomycetes]WVK79395.1 YciI family protein [Dactylosporangium sp. AC04546]GIH43455.1 dehydrogenase [Microbispora corallina]
MRVLVMTKGAGADEEKGTPTAEMFEQMKVYNEQLVNAGIMLGGEGLQPSAKGAQVVFTETGTSVVDGPFAESKELIAGYWIWEVRSLEEAVEWAKRCPYDPRYGADQVLEIRPFYEMADFDATLAAASADEESPAPREEG